MWHAGPGRETDWCAMILVSDNSLSPVDRKLKFIRGAMNMIDLLAIIPFYVSLLLAGLEVGCCYLSIISIRLFGL